MFENWIIKIQSRPGTLMVNIWIYSKQGNKLLIWANSGEVITEKTIDENEIIPPSFVLYQDMLPPFIKAMSEFGVKIPEESFTRGKLEATENHLQDLRQLLKLKK